MKRQLPAGLSDAQRTALTEFFAGHISAGQLTQRLGIEAPPPIHDPPPGRQSPVQKADPEVARAVRTALHRRLALRRAVEDLLRLAPRRSQT